MLEQWARLHPLSPQEVDRAGADVSQADGERMLGWRHESNRLGFGLGCFVASAELGKAIEQVAAVIDRYRSG